MKEPKIYIGDHIPSFSLKDQHGNYISDKGLSGKNTVLFFYPKDFTLGCTKEVCAFGDAYEDFLKYDCEVIGISSDSEESHTKFSKKYNLPFPILSDTGGKLRSDFGVPSSILGFLPGRVTYIINKSGIVKNIFNSQFNSEMHIKKALEYVSNTN